MYVQQVCRPKVAEHDAQADWALSWPHIELKVGERRGALDLYLWDACVMAWEGVPSGD
jgi:hypothetical protein